MKITAKFNCHLYYLECMHGGSIPDSVINQYCWIQGTFVVPRMYKVTSSDHHQ